MPAYIWAYMYLGETLYIVRVGFDGLDKWRAPCEEHNLVWETRLRSDRPGSTTSNEAFKLGNNPPESEFHGQLALLQGLRHEKPLV